jgi:hypothetical protein
MQVGQGPNWGCSAKGKKNTKFLTCVYRYLISSFYTLFHSYLREISSSYKFTLFSLTSKYFREFIGYMFYFFIEAVFHIINFILCWGVNIQNDIIPATS